MRSAESGTTANVLIEFATDLAVREIPDVNVTQADTQIGGDLAGKIRIGATTENCQVLVHSHWMAKQALRDAKSRLQEVPMEAGAGKPSRISDRWKS